MVFCSSIISITLNSFSGVNSQELACGIWHMDLAKAIVAICIHRQSHKYGIFFFIQKSAIFIIHWIHLFPNHHGTTIQEIFFVLHRFANSFSRHSDSNFSVSIRSISIFVL
jgi:hypothetical protein